MARRNDKRVRLVEAARTLFHRQGVNVTTLANIASLANVPLGNVYYYFQSKDAIIKAVIELRKKQVHDTLSAIQTQTTDPRERLVALLNLDHETLQDAVEYGDSLGGLCQELSKESSEIASSAASIMEDVINWCAQQFEGMGKTVDHAKQYALSLISNIQGSRLLGLTFKNPDYITRQQEYLIQWIRAL